MQKTEIKLNLIPIDDFPENSQPVYDESYHLGTSKNQFDFEEERLTIAFQKLPIKRQKIPIMLFVKEKKPEEIAKILNCSAQHVYDQRYHALKNKVGTKKGW